MITAEQYRNLKERYSDVSSWAIWERPGEKPKSNIGIIPDFDNEALHSLMGTGCVFVGLNASNTHSKDGFVQRPWGNFHSGYRYGHDYKLRYALLDTEYWGSYITDVIKRYPEVDSGKVMAILKKNPQVIAENVMDLREELSLLGGVHTLVAIGADAFSILARYCSEDCRVVGIEHFSNHVSKEKYREKVLSALEA